MDLKMGPRSTQERSKTVLESHFCVLKNHLKICLVFDPFLIDFGSLLRDQKFPRCPPCWVRKLIFFGHVIFVTFGSILSWLKRRPRGSQTPPRAAKEAPRGRQGHPRRLQEGPKRPQEPAKKASGHSKRLCKSI